MERSGLGFNFFFFTFNGCKMAAQEKVGFGEFCLTEQDFFGIGVSHSV